MEKDCLERRDSFVRRHSKEDKKKYKRRRRQRKWAAEEALQKPVTRPTFKSNNSTKEKIQVLPFLTRGREMAQRALLKSSLSGVTPSYRSVLVARERLCNKRRINNPSTSSSLPQINRDLLDEDNAPVQLGEGSFGKTFFGKYNGNIPVAIKKYKSNDKYEVWREAEVIANAQKNEHCCNLPLLFGMCTKEKPYILVTQFYGKDAESWTIARAVKESLLSPTTFCEVFQGTLSAIQFLHTKNWLHNDIKQNNVLLHFVGERWHPVLIDFGKSRCISNPKKYKLTNEQKKHHSEKYPWIAPELIDGSDVQSVSTDIFSFGKMVEWALQHFKEKCPVLQDICSSCLKTKADRPSSRDLMKRFDHVHKIH